MTAKEIAKRAKCSLTWVYALRDRLGRLPTVKEVQQRQGKRGRPNRYFTESEDNKE